MGRRPRLDFEGGIHHVMNRGVDRARVFFGDADRLAFGRELGAIHDEHGVETLAYCLMDNHYHVLVRSRRGQLSPAMQELGSRFTRSVNLRTGRDGPLFRGRFASIRVDSDAYLLQATRYIHRNPLDRPGVRRPSDFRWSSYRTYLAVRPAAPFLNTAPVLAMFGDDRRALAAFTESEPVVPRPVRPSDVEHVARFAVAVDDLHHGDGAVSGQTRWARTVLVGLAAEHHDPAVAAAAEQALGFPTAAARRSAVHRFRRRSRDPDVRRLLAIAIDVLPSQRRAA